MRSILSARPSTNGTMMVTDMEAGLEHLSRSTTRAADVMLVVAEPYYKSLETAARVHEMATELGIPRVYLIANKVRTPREAEAVQAFCAQRGLEVLAMIPYDENVAASSLVPQAPLDFCPDAAGVVAVDELVDKLVSTQAA